MCVRAGGGAVAWHVCGGTEEESRVDTHVSVQATGETLTIFPKGYHPLQHRRRDAVR